MSPDTVHLIVNLIRHQRAMMTSIEKWIGKQEPCRTNLELAAATGLIRDVLAGYEAKVSRVDVGNSQDRAPALVTGE